MPVVSIIVPCYNQGQFLHEALDSIEAQTFRDFEIIVVDDGSTFPETIRIIDDLDWPKTSVIRTRNQGLAEARNAGIRHAKGQYILTLDADDKIAPTYLEKAVHVLEQDRQIGIVYCEAEFFGARHGPWKLPPYKFPDILLANNIFASSFFRRSDWESNGGYSAEMVFGWEDFDFWLGLIEKGAGVYRIPEVLFYYRQHGTSMAREFDREKRIRSYKTLFRRHQSLFVNNIEVLLAQIVDKDPLTGSTSRVYHAQLFYTSSGRYSEQDSRDQTYLSHSWTKLNFELPRAITNNPFTLRFDPADGLAFISISELTIKSATSGKVIWCANGRQVLEAIEVAGTAKKLAGAEQLVVLSYGEDPQIYLPPIDTLAGGEPLVFEATLHAVW
jgi:glycosyltransferase involved in cell wall biosynthesis